MTIERPTSLQRSTPIDADGRRVLMGDRVWSCEEDPPFSREGEVTAVGRRNAICVRYASGEEWWSAAFLWRVVK